MYYWLNQKKMESWLKNKESIQFIPHASPLNRKKNLKYLPRKKEERMKKWKSKKEKKKKMLQNNQLKVKKERSKKLESIKTKQKKKKFKKFNRKPKNNNNNNLHKVKIMLNNSSQKKNKFNNSSQKKKKKLFCNNKMKILKLNQKQNLNKKKRLRKHQIKEPLPKIPLLNHKEEDLPSLLLLKTKASTTRKVPLKNQFLKKSLRNL